jgi:hypothetical protein
MIDSNVVAKVVTMNTELLKTLPLEEVLELHPLLNAQDFQFGTAKKVKPIKARPLNTILDKGDQTLSVWEKMLLSTLEGAQSLKRDAFICWGVNNDVWQQAPNKLHDKYTPTEVDVDGWTTFVPKEGEDAVMNSFQVTDASVCGPCGGFAVINPWWGDERLIPAEVLDSKGINPEECGLKPGESVKAYLHYGMVGDWVLQNRKDPIDVYRVAKNFFDATYET